MNNITLDQAIIEVKKIEKIMSEQHEHFSIHHGKSSRSVINSLKNSKNCSQAFYSFLKEFVSAKENSGLNIRYVPIIYRTRELKELAIVNNSNCLTYIENTDEKLCVLALNNNYGTLNGIKNITKKILLAYAKNKDESQLDEETWNLIPKKYKNDIDIIQSLLKKGVLSFLVNENSSLLTPDLYKKSVLIRPISFYDIPEEKLNNELVEIYFNSANKDVDYDLCGFGFRQIPEKFLTKSRCLIAVKSNGYNLRSIPRTIVDKEICLEAIKSNAAGALAGIPKKFMNEEMLRAIIDSCVNKQGCFPLEAIFKVYPQLITENIIEEAINLNAGNLQYVPENWQTEKLCNLALSKNPSVIKYVKNPTYEMYMDAISKDMRLKKTHKHLYNQFNGDDDIKAHITNHKKKKCILEYL